MAKPPTARPRNKRAAKALRRVGAETSETRQLILDAARDLMVDEGYAAVTTRKVAARADLSPALVQYYFQTMDDLFLALFRSAADAVAAWQAKALKSDQPLHELWALHSDPKRMTIAMEFMALSNHRKEIQAEIAAYNERARAAQIEVLAQVVDRKILDPKLYPPALVSVLIAALGRALVMEETQGIYTGHSELRDFVAAWLKRLEPTQRRSRRS